ncbi:MAG: sodium-dependent transporter, partial [Deltaproteobacteria bacterium]
MAVGAGNIWRFPRVAAAQGGGAFVLAWMVALLVWSLPLLLLEYRWGSATGGSPLKVFTRKAGWQWVPAGGFVAVCCCAIMCYYSVVSGWCLLYLAQGAWLPPDRLSLQTWWNSTEGSLISAAAAIAALFSAAFVVVRGVRSGIERVSKLMVPALFLLLCMAAVYAIMMPGAEAGISFLFEFDASRLADHRIWLEAFSQSAWSTGAGWGLMLVYAGYDRNSRFAVSNSFLTGFGNNLASILAAMAIMSTLFAMLGRQDALSTAASGNQGLAFVWLPSLFLGMESGGR